MITYDTYCRIKQMHRDNLRITQIAAELGLDERTVSYWIKEKNFRQRKQCCTSSKLDSYKPQIIRWLEIFPYSGVQIYQRLRSEGYQGGSTIVREYVARIRPRKTKAFLTLSFDPGECAQVDWGQYGTVRVGSTERRLSFFVMVLCYSRMMYLEFTVSETMEIFLQCHRNAFEFFGAVPKAIMLDNLKCAVLMRLIGQAPVFNPRYLEIANHYGFEIRACGVGKGNEKGRVENGVGYVKKNFLAGLDIPDFNAVNPAACTWRDEIANVRPHGTTHKPPIELFGVEKPAMSALPIMPYDTSVTRTARANNRFRVALDSNRYSVPADYANALLNIKVYADRLCIYHESNLIAHHARSFDRNKDFEHPDHPRELVLQRKKANEQRLHLRFIALSHKAEDYYQEIVRRRMNHRHHIRQIIALSEIYGIEKVAQAIEDAFTYQAFSCEYITNILEQRSRILPEPGALHVTRRQDLLEIEIPEPDLSIYDKEGNQNEGANDNDQL